MAGTDLCWEGFVVKVGCESRVKSRSKVMDSDMIEVLMEEIS